MFPSVHCHLGGLLRQRFRTRAGGNHNLWPHSTDRTDCIVSVFACSVTEQAANAIIRTADGILLICVSYPTKPASRS